MIHVGAKVDKDSSDNLSSAICSVFKSARENGISEQVQMAALNVMSGAFDVSHVTIQSCNISNDSSKTVEVNVPSEFVED